MNYYALLTLLICLSSANLSSNECTRFLFTAGIKEAFIHSTSDKRNLDVTFSFINSQTGATQSANLNLSNSEELVHIAVDLVSTITNPNGSIRDLPIAFGKTIVREKLLAAIAHSLETSQIKDDLMSLPVCKTVSEKALDYPAISILAATSCKYLFRALFDTIFDSLIKPCGNNNGKRFDRAESVHIL